MFSGGRVLPFLRIGLVIEYVEALEEQDMQAMLGHYQKNSEKLDLAIDVAQIIRTQQLV